MSWMDDASARYLAERRRAERDRRYAGTTCRACLADWADVGTFDHGIPHAADAGCRVTPGTLCPEGDRRVGNHMSHV